MTQLCHPNCVRPFELVTGRSAGGVKENFFIISERARGRDLYHYLGEVLQHLPRITEEWVAGIFKQVSHGVAYLHDSGIRHNDLKPENILILQQFSPLEPTLIPNAAITDFGCAMFSKASSFKHGDPRYQAPEVWRAMIASWQKQKKEAASLVSAVDCRADVWSL